MTLVLAGKRRELFAGVNHRSFVCSDGVRAELQRSANVVDSRLAGVRVERGSFKHYI